MKSRLLGPILFFFFNRYVQFDWIQTDDLQLSAAVRAFDGVAFVGIFIHLNFRVTFGARPSWHLSQPSVVFSLPSYCSEHHEKYLNRNADDLQEAQRKQR
jgi:hypothetical protein